MDAIFKALNDPCRRAILDLLAERDGRTSGQIEIALGDRGFTLTRFGVMKHLKVLEQAKLLVPRRAGRFKHHHFNALPLVEVMDRWLEPLTQKHMARAMIDLKRNLEGDT